MLQSARHIYALSMWSVERRPNGWYFSKSAYHGDRHDWRGPYSSEMSVTLMIARELLREIKKRYAWKDIVRLRREQIAAGRQKQQPTLFELRHDCRPTSQQTTRGRYEEPTLFEVD